MDPFSALADSGRPPGMDEIEVSLFGPGYGEAVALHVGDNQWILVDSCVPPGFDHPASLDYLKRLGVDVRDAVKLVVATHWHDDHVRGISTIFRECISAQFFLSAGLQTRDFLTLLALHGGTTIPGSSGVNELAAIVQNIRQRSGPTGSQGLQFALADRLIWKTTLSGTLGQTALAYVFSLSPSDASLLQAQLAFAQMIPAPTAPKRRVPSPSRNDVAVALWLQIGERRVLLGSDVERSSNPGLGWSAILDNSQVATGQAEVFKVSHHGADSGDEPRVWKQMLYSDPFAVLSPFRHGGVVLPNEADRARIRSYTPHAFTAAFGRRKRHKWENRIVRDMVQATVRNIENVDHGWGQVRLRSGMSSGPMSWRVELFGDASPL